MTITRADPTGHSTVRDKGVESSIDHEFAATALREGKWWVITVPELDAVTQARNVREIEDMAGGLIAALLDRDEDTVRVSVKLELPEDVAAIWAEAATSRDRAVEEEKRAALLRRQAVRELLTTFGLSQKDIAAVLGLSPQRVQQLAQ